MNYFGLIRAAAGWPSSMSFLPVSTRSLPSIRRIEKFLSRKLPTLDVFAVRREGDRFRQAADLELLHLRHFVSVDAQENRRSVLVVEERFLAGVRAAQQGGGGKIAARTDGEAFGPVADHNLVEDARRIGVISMMLIVWILPSADPAPPLSAVIASLPSGVKSTL